MYRLLTIVGITLALYAVEIRAGEIPPSFQTIATALRHACIETTGATVEQIENASNGNFANDDKLKCYLSCILGKFSLVNGNEIDFDLMALLLPPEVAVSGMKMINNCRHITGAEICETSFNLMKCFYEQVPEDFFVV